MPPDPNNPSSEDTLPSGGVPHPLPADQPPVIAAAPPVVLGSPPPAEAALKPWSVRAILAFLLSACLGLFLADAAVSLADDSLILFFGIRVLAGIRGIVFLFTVLTALVVYGLMALTPMIPKRVFLPVTLFNPVAALIVIPGFIYFYGRIQQVSCVISLCQVVFGLGILYLLQGGLKFRWPLVAEKQLAARRFSWPNLSLFLLVNLLVLVPAVIVYLVLCAALAVSHFSDGFLSLRPGGFTVQVRKYTRPDGKTIQLFPMAHIGDPEFYRKLSQAFPANSIILMEGVSDDRNLLTNRITYERAATSLGLAEQQKEFKPSRGRMVRADVDVEEFGTNTIGFLNLVMLIHSQGLKAENILKLLSYSPPPRFEEQLLDDLVRKRNRHLLEELHDRLSQSDHFIVPWGVAHMPGIAGEIQKSGFRLDETRDYVVIRFHSARKETKP